MSSHGAKSSYEKVKGGKLSLKGGPGSDAKISKNKKKKKKKTQQQSDDLELEAPSQASSEIPKDGKKQVYEIDRGTGFAPDGKKSLLYEELFPVERKRFGYVAPEELSHKSREEALEERVKKKADRYCK